MQLIDIKEIKGKIILKSGLHIGAGDTEMHIGGTDNPVIKHPHTQEPYIPGSSLKGKVRSLLEMKSGLMAKTNGRPVQAALLKKLNGDEREECEKILKLFGSSGAEGEE
ncbi:MAG: type III-A CRISPR-associated RAMP protein Csm3, partial [Syntrophobacterales bacterium CG03_land_8_20_14_0_80_58_14]